MVTTTDVALVDVALSYAERGWAVLPLIGKVPVFRNPHPESSEERKACKGGCGKPGHGVHDASTRPDRIRNLFRSAPGATGIGVAIPEAIAVLDVDTQHGGMETFKEWMRENGGDWFAGVPRQRSGNGGLHLYFANEHNLVPATPDAPGIECWQHGRFMVVWPSVHPDTGAVYQWEVELPTIDDVLDGPALPQWFIEMYEVPPAPARTYSAEYEPGEDPFYNAAHAYTSWSRLLESIGWSCVGGDGDTDGSLWRHPKATAKWSGVLRHDCLFVFTPNTPFPVTVSKVKKNGVTLFRAIAIVEHGESNQATRKAMVHAGFWKEPNYIDWLIERGVAIEDRTATGNATSTGSADDEHASYRQVDLREMLAGNIVRVEPTILRREEDRAALLYPGRVNGIHGDSGSGKSMIAAFAAAEQIRAGHHVGWIDFEDPDASTVVERLRMFGLGDDEILERFHYYGPVEPFDEIAAQMIVADAKTYGFTLVVIDSLGEAFGLEGINEDKDNEVNPWLRRVARVIAAAASDDEHDGPAVTLIDHSTKAKDNPLYASGSKRKRAAITGASYLVTDVVPLTRENGGSVALTCAKDRHGNYRRGEIVANFWISPRDAYANPTVKLYPPRKENADDNDDDLLGQLIRAAIEAIEMEGRPLTQREMLATMNIKASDERKKAGIDGAVSLGKLRIRKGPNKAQLHELIVDEPDTL